MRKKPPMIMHMGNKRYNKKAIETCAWNIRLTQSATKLLLYYASCASGFRPALKTIEEAAGIAANKVSEIRKELVDHGVIGYDGKCIYVAWDRIYLFAGLCQRLPKGGRYAPVVQPESRKVTVGELSRCFKALPPLRELSPREEAFLTYLEGLTMEEYRKLIAAMAPKGTVFLPEIDLETLREKEKSILHGATPLGVKTFAGWGIHREHVFKKIRQKSGVHNIS